MPVFFSTFGRKALQTNFKMTEYFENPVDLVFGETKSVKYEIH